MATNSMSDRLKDTLGMLERSGNPVQDVPTNAYDDDDSVSVGSRGGEVVVFEPKSVPSTIADTEQSDIRDDYITSRNITHTLIEMAGKALTGAMDVAIETQHPKAYTVFNELATTMRGLSKDLLEMQKIFKQINEEKAAKEAAARQPMTQNNVSITTTNVSLADVLKAIKESEKNVIDAEVIDNE